MEQNRSNYRGLLIAAVVATVPIAAGFAAALIFVVWMFVRLLWFLFELIRLFDTGKAFDSGAIWIEEYIVFPLYQVMSRIPDGVFALYFLVVAVLWIVYFVLRFRRGRDWRR